MSLNNVGPGKSLPDDVNVIVEIPRYGDPIKYEVDKETGAMFVDRFMSTAMHYPCNYGYIPQTLSDDGDPADVLVLAPFPLVTGSVVRCRRSVDSRARPAMAPSADLPFLGAGGCLAATVRSAIIYGSCWGSVEGN